MIATNNIRTLFSFIFCYLSELNKTHRTHDKHLFVLLVCFTSIDTRMEKKKKKKENDR